MQALIDSQVLQYQTLLVSFLIGFILWIIFKFRAALTNIQHHPGFRVLFAPNTIQSMALPAIKGITLGYDHTFHSKHIPFQKAGWDILSVVSAYPVIQTHFDIADAAIIKQVASSRYLFPKPLHQYEALLFFGKNIIASDGEEWKRYRKITAPAFSDRNNRLVWDESCYIMLDLFSNVWGDQQRITANDCNEVTLQVALSVIGIAGFGRRVAFIDDQVIPSSHYMTFKDALQVVSTEMFLKMSLPTWALGLTPRLRRVRLAFDELEKYMVEMIHARNTSETKERHDLFNSLLKANNDNEGDAKLSTKEVLGNVFIFQLAGHETTAHTLCFTFALLALHPDEQEILYQHIKQLLPDDRLPTYEEMPRFTQSMAVFYETLRMFPPTPAIPKISAKDTSLTATNAAGETKSIPIPQGTIITFNTPALHYNPRYWEDPYIFKPSRFLEDWPRDAFIPFSTGARACLGRKFFETEGIAILTMLLSRYKIMVKEEPQFADETLEERKARILAAKPGITLTPVRVPLVFERRY